MRRKRALATRQTCPAPRRRAPNCPWPTHAHAPHARSRPSSRSRCVRRNVGTLGSIRRESIRDNHRHPARAQSKAPADSMQVTRGRCKGIEQRYVDVRTFLHFSTTRLNAAAIRTASPFVIGCVSAFCIRCRSVGPSRTCEHCLQMDWRTAIIGLR
eukprot:scaffold166949_cov32-Tisochrysis_lutea.AAC.12